MSPRAAVRAGLHLETTLAAERGHADPGRPVLVAGMDEVGRGALAGPVVVGVCAARVPTSAEPPAVRDSKALSDARRRALVPEIHAWAAHACLGEAGPAEIDALGLSAALSLAGRRAWAALCSALGEAPVGLILDGRDDWLTRGGPALAAAAGAQALDPAWPVPPAPLMVVRAEDQAATVAAASIVAKVGRDDMMVALDAEQPAYGWAGNKGYGAAAHRAALLRDGASAHHRRSWNLGLAGAGAAGRPAGRSGSRTAPEPDPGPPTLFD